MHTSRARLVILALAASFLVGATALAQTPPPQPGLLQRYDGQVKPNLTITIPTLQFSDATYTENGTIRTLTVPFLAQYLSAVYRYGVGIAAVVAAVMAMVGGLQYLTAGADSTRVSAAKERISNALVGLALAVGSYVILSTINQDLVTLKPLVITQVKGIPVPDNETFDLYSQTGSGLLGGAASGQVNQYLTQVPTTATQLSADLQPNAPPNLKQYTYSNVPYLDSQQKCPNMPDGKLFSIASSGCGPTSAAMVVAAYRPDLNAQELPPIMAALSTAGGFRTCTAGCRSCSGTIHTFFTSPATMGKYGLKGEALGGGPGVRDRAIALLKQNKPLVAAFGSPSLFTCGGHFVVLVNSDGNTVKVNDPGRNDSPYTSDKCPRTGGLSIPASAVPIDKVFIPQLSNVWYIHP
jgi:hypothetical protein